MAKFDPEFEIFIPTRIHFGLNKSKELGDILSQYGFRAAMVFTDSNLIKAGVFENIESSLQGAKIKYLMFDRIKENPDIETVLEAKANAEGEGFDCIIGVGGGGPIDVAKAVSVALTHSGDIRDYIAYTTGQKKPIENKVLPIITVPTTSGSGAEVSPVAVIVDRKIETKIGLFSEHLFPRAAVVDPTLTVTLPPLQTAGAGMDIFAHAFDAFISPWATIFTDALAKEAMEAVFKYLRIAIQEGDNLEARSALSIASIMALLSIYFGKGGAVHTIGEPLGTIYNIPHGYTCGYALPAMMNFLIPVMRERFSKIYSLIGDVKCPGGSKGDLPQRCISEVKKLIRETGLPEISTIVSKPDIDKLSKASETHLAIDRVPMPISREDYIDIYSKIFSKGYLSG